MRRLKTMLLAAAALSSLTAAPAFAAEPLNVVASFSILGDLVMEVGGEHVAVTTIVGPNEDAHVHEPSPSDARAAAAADLVVVNGLGFEGWLDRLLDASGTTAPVVVASDGVAAIGIVEQPAAHAGDQHEAAVPEAGHHHEGAADPHAWQSVGNAVIYVANIARALCSTDKADCAAYAANAAAYTAKLAALDERIRASLAAIAPEQRKIITSHDAFGYFAKAYGIEILAPQGVSTESEASAADVAALVDQIRSQRVTALFVESMSDPRLIAQIARETGVRPGGKLFSDALSELDGAAGTYVKMMEHNLALLQGAMAGS